MQVRFKHPLATHHAMEVLGYRRNGSPIYAIAGGGVRRRLRHKHPAARR
jgi:hypothetical protein